MKTLLKGGRVLDPSQNLDTVCDVLIEDSQIVALGQELKVHGSHRAIDCRGYWVTPGLVDPHVNLREPGESHKETIITGTQAAAAGGFTTICCTPNTHPPLDNPALVDFLIDKSASPEAGGVFVAPVGALTVGLEGKRPSDYSAMKQAGIVAVSDEPIPTQDASVMATAMELCVQYKLPILAHCEDLSLSKGGCMNDGAVSAMLGLKGIPRSAEEIMVMRNCLLALETGCPLHILRVSTWGAVEMVRQAKHLGAPVTCEVTPPHLVFTEEAVGQFDTRFKMNPPLRSQRDVDLLMQALSDGTVDVICADHCPHSTYEVHVPFDQAPFGGVGLESLVGVCLTHLVHTGVITPLEWVRKVSTNPAKILDLEGGTLQAGATPVAQVTVIDPDVQWTFSTEKTFSKSKNSPFEGMDLIGKAVLTFNGEEIYRDALFEPGRETFL